MAKKPRKLYAPAPGDSGGSGGGGGGNPPPDNRKIRVPNIRPVTPVDRGSRVAPHTRAPFVIPFRDVIGKINWPPGNPKPPDIEPAPPPVYAIRELTQNAKGDCYPVIYGTQRVGGKVVFYKTDVMQRYLYVDIIVCEGPIQAIRDIRFGEFTPEQLGLTLGSTYNVYLGTNNQALDPLCNSIEPLYVSAKPGTAHVTFKFDGNRGDASNVDIYSFKCTVDGLLIRDPRTDATLVNRYFRANPPLATIDLLTDRRYGAGFPDDQFDWISTDPTHSWKDAADDCDYVLASQASPPGAGPDVAQGAYGTGPFFNGNTGHWVFTYLVNGIESVKSPDSTFNFTQDYVSAVLTIPNGPAGTTQKRIYRRKVFYPPETAYYLAGTIDDNTTTTWVDTVADYQLKATVPPLTGPTRYRIGLAMMQQRSLESWLEVLRTLFAGNFNYDGKYHVWIDKARSDSGITFDRTNILGDVQISTMGLASKWSKVHGKFVNVDSGFKDDEASVEIPTLAQPPTENEREERRVGEYDLAGSPSYDQTVRILRQILNRSQLTRQIVFTAMYRGIRIMPGMIVTVSHDTGPLVNAKVMVTGIRLLADDSVAIAGEFYDTGVYSDTVQTNPAPILPPAPGPAAIPPNPTSCAVSEIIEAGPRGETISRLKVEFTPAPTSYATNTLISVTAGANPIRVVYVVPNGPVFIENPTLNVLHTIKLQTINPLGILSIGVMLTITPVGASAPNIVTGLMDDSLKVLRVTASTARKYVWDYFLRVIWDPLANSDVKQYRVRYSSNPADAWADMTRELLVPANKIEQIGASPATIPGLKRWYKADDLAGIVADGGQVSTWTDASGGGNHATQATGSKKPIFKTGILNGRPVIRFDGSDDCLDAAAPGISGDSWSYFAVVRPVSVVAATIDGRYAVDRSSATPAIVALMQPASTSNYGMQVRDNNSMNLFTLDSGVAAVAGTPKMISWHRNYGTALEMYIDGVQKISNADIPGSVTPPPLRIGDRASSGGTTAVNWDFAEIIIFEGYLSQSNRQAIENYLNDKYAILPRGTTFRVGDPSRNILRADLTPFVSRDRTEIWEPNIGEGGDHLIFASDNFYAYNVIVRAETYGGALGPVKQIIQAASNSSVSLGTPPPYVPQTSESKTLSNGLNSNLSIASASGAITATGPTTAFSIGGITGGAAGRWLMFFNTTTQTMTIVNEDASSTAANRITTLTGGDVVLSAKAMAVFFYDGGTSRWVLTFANDGMGGFTTRGINTKLFTSSGSWTCPDGVTKAYLTGCGGGGGGGGGGLYYAGGGGGGADAILRKEVTVVPGTVYTITIANGGSAGSGGNPSGTSGGTGQTTSFGALLSLVGGGGGYPGSDSNAGNGGTSGGPGGGCGQSAFSNSPGLGGAHMLGTLTLFSGTGSTGPYGCGGSGGVGSGGVGGPGFLYVEY